MPRFSPLRFAPLFFMGLFYGLAMSPPSIYNTEFLTGRGFTTQGAAEMYIYGSLIGIVLLAILPSLLSRFGARTVILRLIALVSLGSFALALFPSHEFTFIAFLAFLSVQIVIYSLLDFFLEAKIDGFEGITGRVRGLYLATMNFTFTVGPYVAGFIISRFSFTHLYLFTAVMSLLFLLLVSHLTRNFHDAKYPRITLGYITRTIFKNPSVAKILAINFLLQMRYAFVVIFLTIYLHQVLGFSIEVVGLMVMIAGIPFFLIQYPLGAWADRQHGERKMMVFGFAVTSIGALLLAFTPTTSISLMTAILTVMFAGAAMIEVMSESFFFKHVKSRDDAHLVAFRMLIPAAYLSAPFLAGLVLAHFPMNYIFVAAASVSVFGIPLAISLGSKAHRAAAVRAFT